MASSQQPSTASIRSQRVFGIAEETPETKHLDNVGILTLHQETIKSQDDQLDALMTIVGRQKEIGKAIGDELDVQNKLLDDLEGRVDITGARMKGAIQQAKKLS